MAYFESLPNLLLSIGVMVAALAIAYGVRFLLQDVKFKQVYERTKIIVRAIEQELKLDGPRKKELAMIAIGAFARKIGANLTEEEISQLIEAAVQLMNVELKEA